MAAPSRNHGNLDRLPANRTGLTAAPINPVAVLETAFFAVQMTVVIDAGATLFYGLAQHRKN